MNQTQMENAIEYFQLDLEEVEPVRENGFILVYAIYRKPRKTDRNGNTIYSYTLHVMTKGKRLWDITESVARIFGVKRGKNFGEIVSQHTANEIMQTVSEKVYGKNIFFAIGA